MARYAAVPVSDKHPDGRKPLTDFQVIQREEEEAAFLAGEGQRNALAEIERLEAEVTNRRLREAVLTQAGADWLAAQEALIAAERAKL